jgi:uncharacterized sporulation protein YeaH/YhbH (DUF444 family)
MPKRIQEDHKKFRDVISGRSRRELKKLIKSGAIVRRRPKGGKVNISIPQIDIPHFVFGDMGEGVGRGPGKDGDVIGRDPKPGQGGGGAGQGEAEGITISIDMEDVLKFMEDELRLPKMKPKPNETFEDIKIKYNDISKVGLNSLRHIRRTMKEALKRSMMMKSQLIKIVPGSQVPIKVITPIKADFRYRQYKEEKIPSSNAVIFFARDCSGSMDDYRCDVVSDMSWWLDCWIRKFYKRVDRCYFVHDTRAEEVDEQKFYSYRQGGGTQCSSAFDAVADQLVNRYPPEKFNVYFFYFSDGDNWGGDNDRIIKIINERLGPNIVNMIGITQVCSWSYDGSVKYHMDAALKAGQLNKDHVKTAYVGPESKDSSWSASTSMTEEDRNQQIIEAIRKLLSANPMMFKETEVF